ncbi:MAG TPA: CapA family protein [Candidatus Pacearchaeota archaeon]|nr:CapA family protein [Candidatus Pacearchaeota archaeon]
MKKKFLWLVIIFILIAVFLISIYYLNFSKNKNISENQEQNEKEFLDFFSEKKKLPIKKEEVSLIAVGDISYSRGVERIVKKQNDINYPFLKIGDYLKNADLVFGNLETPITEGREINDFEMIFRSNPLTKKALKLNNFSILSLANNHTPNFGEKGLKDTFFYLEKEGIKYVGAGENEKTAYQPVYIEKKGIKFAFFAYNDSDVVPLSYKATENFAGTAFMETEKMIEAVKEAKQKSDFVIVSMHSGNEYVNKPNSSQVNFAHSAIDAGADLVIGHHPHVVQILEKYKDKYIFYSLGNFIFDQQASETRKGLMIKVYFTKDEITKISLLPIIMKNLAQPEIADINEAKKILQRLNFPTSKQNIYFKNNDTFEKDERAVIYVNTLQKQSNIFKKEKRDLNNNLFFETYELKNGKLTIEENKKNIWESPDNWWIDDFNFNDSNNDGIVDINLSLWKPGNFGKSKPFWVEENDMSIKNHFFILDLIGNSIKEVWGSSNLSNPNCEFKFADIDNDKENELIVVEGDYLEEKCNGNFVAVWKWNGWGFSNEWRSEKGNFSNLEIEKINNKNYILVDTY